VAEHGRGDRTGDVVDDVEIVDGEPRIVGLEGREDAGIRP
jgi:hypothetical protein